MSHRGPDPHRPAHGAPPPRIGAVVHYRPYPDPGSGHRIPRCQPAIIAVVHTVGVDPMWMSPANRELAPGPLVGLCVFTADGPRMHDAEQDERSVSGGTWHWPRDGCA